MTFNRTKLQEFITQMIVLDTETTGVDDDSHIIELSMTFPHDLDMGIDDVLNYTMRYNPGIPVPPESSAVHFISTEDLVNEVTYESELPNIELLMIQDHIDYYVGHNVQFDQRMINENYLKYNSELPAYLLDNDKWICTLRLAKKLFAEDPEFANLTLSYLWFKFGLHTSVNRPINAHAAKDDVFMCFKVLIKLIEVCIERGHINPDLDIGPQLIEYVNTPMRYSVMPFGKHKGELMKNVPLNYLEWMIKNSDVLDEDMPNFDMDFAFTVQSEYLERVN